MNESEVLVKVEGLSKKFCKDLKTSLWYGVQDLVSNIRGNKNERQLRDKEFWAVKNINFELRRGECLGLIGHNGAGKSTLLKILNGLINPDAGKITIKGNVGALIELGAGFNPILSGRENIYNNGAVLGFNKEEIDSKIENIIDFSEIREFIDMPVQNYSSGMKVRLGFAVAAQMEPDVLIIDEVLAVGDLGFVTKCFKKIDSLLPKTAVVFVSHSMPMVSRISTQILLMEKGRMEYYGKDVAVGINSYYKKFTNNTTSVLLDDGSIEDFAFEILTDNNIVNWGEDLNFTASFKNNKLKQIPYISIGIYDKENRPVVLMRYDEKKVSISKGKIRLNFIHKKIQLSRGVYTFNVIVNEKFNRNAVFRVNNIQQLFVECDTESFPPFLLDTTLLDVLYEK